MPFRTLPLAIAILLVLLPQGAAADSTARIIIQREARTERRTSGPTSAPTRAAKLRRNSGRAAHRGRRGVARRAGVGTAQARPRSRRRRGAARPHRPSALAPHQRLNARSCGASTSLDGGAPGRAPPETEETLQWRVADLGCASKTPHADLDDRLSAPDLTTGSIIRTTRAPRTSNGPRHARHRNRRWPARTTSGSRRRRTAGPRPLSLRGGSTTTAPAASPTSSRPSSSPARRGIRVVNASLGAVGGAARSSENVIALATPGTLFVTAAGNSRTSTTTFSSAARYPLRVRISPNILCVGASNTSRTRERRGSRTMERRRSTSSLPASEHPCRRTRRQQQLVRVHAEDLVAAPHVAGDRRPLPAPPATPRPHNRRSSRTRS